jgi:hypothetical protein
MHIQSNCGSDVFLALDRRRQLSRFGDPRAEDIRVGLLVAPGGIRTAISAGLGGAFHQFGLMSFFSDLFGISGGAANGQFGIALQIVEHYNIYWTNSRALQHLLDRGDAARILFVAAAPARQTCAKHALP